MKNSIFNAVCKTRYLALLVVLIFTCGNAWGASTTVSWSDGSYSNSTITWSATDICTIYQEQNGAQTAPSSSYVSAPRWYSGNKITITAGSNVSTFTSIVITATSNTYGNTLATSGYTVTGGTGSISASNNNGTVTISMTGTVTAFTIVMDGQSRLSSGSNPTINYTAASPATAHTVTFTKTDGSTQTITEASAGAGVIPPAMDASCGYWEFQGWSLSESDDEESTDELALVTITAGKYNPSADVTLYPVYTKTETGEPVETKTQTFQYDTWTKGGSTANKSSYRLCGNGGYVESASTLDFSTLSKVIVYGGTYGGSSYNSISIRKADGTVWKNATVSGASQTGENSISGGTSLTGSAKLRVYSTCGDASSNGVRISKVEIFTMEAGSVTYYYSYPSCSKPTQVATPTFSVAGGTYNNNQSVTISCATDGATIRYTTDGTDPTSSSSVYSSALSITGTTTLKAKAFKDGLTESEISSATYTLKCATPTFSPASESFCGTENVTLGCMTSDAIIRYTTDGTTPTSSSTAYSSTIQLSSTTTIKAKAFKSGYTDSDEASASYTNTALTTIQAIFDAATSSEVEYCITFDNWVVSGASSSGKNIYVTDGSKGFIIYGNSDTGFRQGDILSGTVTCNLLLFNNSAELKNLTTSTTGLTVTKGGNVTPVVKNASEIADLTGINTGIVITTTGVVETCNSNKQCINGAQLYNQLYDYAAVTTGNTYTATGVYLQYGGTHELLPLGNLTTFTITATSNNDSWGTVSVTESIITATPNTGYRVIAGDGGYSVTSGTATVVNNGDNTFTVTPSSDCTVRINFEAIPKYTITLKDDNTTITQTTAGAAITLPSRTGCDGYTFAGWTKSWTEPQESWTTTAPTIIPAGSYTPTDNENLYPVYTKTEGGIATYTLISDAASFTDGTYVVGALASDTYYFMDGNGTSDGLGVETTGLATSSVSEGSFAATLLPSGGIEIEVEDDEDPDGDDHYYFIWYESSSVEYFLNDNGTKQSILWDSESDEVYTYHPNFTQNAGTDGCVLLSGSGAKVSQNGSNKASFIRNYASGGSFYNDIYFFKKSGGSTTYYISVPGCCEDIVTLATNSPANGSITFSPSGPIATCGAEASSRQTTMTITPDAGYYLSAWSTTGVTPYSVNPSIVYGSVSNSGAQATTVTFNQNTTTGTYTANATFTAIPVSSLSLRAQQTGQSDKTGSDLTMNCYPKEGQTGGNDPLSHTLNVAFYEVLPADALDKTYTWSVRVKASGAADWTNVDFTGNQLNTNAIINYYNNNTGLLKIGTNEGTAEIKITANDASGVSAKVTITVAKVSVTSISVDPTSMNVYAGQKKPVTITFTPLNASDKAYTTGSYSYVTIRSSGSNPFYIEGNATEVVRNETVTVTSDDGSKTATVAVTVNPLPKATFVDIVQNKTDFVGVPSTGILSSTVDEGGLTVTTTKNTPTHADVAKPATGNNCEKEHLHLVGWILKDWADENPDATSAQIAAAGAGYFYAAGSEIDLVAKDGKTFYAVWAKEVTTP